MMERQQPNFFFRFFSNSSKLTCKRVSCEMFLWSLQPNKGPTNGHAVPVVEPETTAELAKTETSPKQKKQSTPKPAKKEMPKTEPGKKVNTCN